MIKKYDVFIRWLLCALYSAVFCVTLSSMTELGMSSMGVAFCSVVVSTGCFTLFNIKYGKIIYPSVYFSLIAIIIGYYAIRFIFGFADISEEFNYVINVLAGYQSAPKTVLKLVFYFMTALLSATFVLFFGKRINSVVLCICAIVCLYGALITNSVVKSEQFIVMIALLCVVCSFSVYLKWVKGKNSTGVGIEGVVVTIVSVVCAVAVVFASMPFSTEQKGWFEIGMLSKDYYKDNGEGAFSLGQHGMGDADEELGGDCNLTDDVALSVKSDYPFYAVATYKDYYDTKSWLVSDIHKNLYENNGEVSLDAKIMSVVLTRNSIDVYQNNVAIEYETLESRSVVNSSNVIDFNAKNKLYLDRNNNIFTNEALKNGDKYTFTSIYYNLDEVYKFLSSDDYKASISQAGAVIKKSEYTEYMKSLTEKYTTIPYDMPKEVDWLAQEIVREAGAEKQIDKVMALVDYLSRFEYTKEGEIIADDEDFVYEFLFETQKGYCTYFASALAMMARTVGMASRYCEGFSPVSSGAYEVTNENLHAWVEIYFEGLGWVIFEPTPANQVSVDILNNTKTDENDKITYSQIQAPVISGGKNNASSGEQNSEGAQEQATQNTGKKPLSVKEEEPVNATALLTAVAVLLAIVLITARIVLRALKDRALNKLERREYVCAVWREVKKLMIYDMKKSDASFTVRQQNKLCDESYSAGHSAYNDVFERALYSSLDITETDRANAQKYYNHILKRVVKNKGKLRYLFAKYILYKI